MRTINWNRVLSAGVALFYLVGGGLAGGEKLVLRLIVFLILPMACIGFGEAMGSISGPTSIFLSGVPAFTKQSPGFEP